MTRLYKHLHSARNILRSLVSSQASPGRAAPSEQAAPASTPAAQPSTSSTEHALTGAAHEEQRANPAHDATAPSPTDEPYALNAEQPDTATVDEGNAAPLEQGATAPSPIEEPNTLTGAQQSTPAADEGRATTLEQEVTVPIPTEELNSRIAEQQGALTKDEELIVTPALAATAPTETQPPNSLNAEQQSTLTTEEKFTVISQEATTPIPTEEPSMLITEQQGILTNDEELLGIPAQEVTAPLPADAPASLSAEQQSDVTTVEADAVETVERNVAIADEPDIAPPPLDPIPFNANDNSAVRVLFVAQHPALLANWRSLLHTMQKDSRFIAKVVLCPFLHPYSSTSITLDDMKQSLMKEGIPFSTIDVLSPSSFRPHIVFLQNPYDETRPDTFRSTSLTNNGIRVAYIPYGLEMGGGAWNLKAQFDLPVHRQAWRVFARSQRHKIMFGKYCRSGNSHVAVTGHPKFDSISIPKEKAPPQELTEKIKGRKVILWTPHFSVTPIPSWSTYKLYSDAIFKAFAKRRDLFLLLRPHPLFYKSMVGNGLWDERGEVEFKTMIDNSDNIGLDELPDYHVAFSVSDALMTDVGSFLLEYLAVNKPLLYLHHPDGLGMNDDGILTESLYKANNDKDILNFINQVSVGDDPLRNEREHLKPEFLFGLDGNIANNICDEIHQSLSAGDTWSPGAKLHSSSSQQKSEHYWKNSTTTYLAPPEYYEKKANILNEVLEKLPPAPRAIDIGCGDGKYTLQLAKFAGRVTGYELSTHLVEQAIAKAKHNNVSNVEFIPCELDDIIPLERFELISCLGVTSCIIDDLKFIFFLQKLNALAKPGATLLMIDSLSTVSECFAEDQSGYQAKYRSLPDYKILIERAGFTHHEEITLSEAPEKKLVNKLFILKNKTQLLTADSLNRKY
ncbi:methyltransferase domain-containing protein [Pseudomonas arcuscaelestis]|nr:methyltransferase domain-containing protein [Pseudomonas arcuscaelestis]